MPPVVYLDLGCPHCGPVRVDAATAVVHHHHRDGFRLLQAYCPSCTEVLVTTDEPVLDDAASAGVPQRELLSPAGPLTAADLDDLREALADEGWCARLGEG